jgi:membrane protease YdiL (CAAX protease family)
MTGSGGRAVSGRRADRLRRNPFVVIVVGFLVLFGGFEGTAQLLSQALSDSPSAWLLTAVVVAALAFVVYWGLITRFLEGRPTAPEIRVDGRTARLFGGGLVVAVLLMAIAYGIIAMLGSATIVSANPWPAALAWSLAMAIVTAVVEELFLRGVLFRVTELYLGSWLALAVSALFFGFLHLANPEASLWAGVAIALEAGVSLAAVFILTRSLWAPIGVHVGWNLSEALLGVPVSGNTPSGVISTTFTGPAWLTGGAFGMEASVVVVLIWLAFAGGVLLIALRRGRLMQPRWRQVAT